MKKNTHRWMDKVDAVLGRLSGQWPELQRFAIANREAARQTVSGQGPDKAAADTKAGAHMVVNMPAPHVPKFCKAAADGDREPYKNCYQLEALRFGSLAPKTFSATRELVDKALPLPKGCRRDQVYFGAVELSGSGIRFYGDICLVLTRDAIDDKTIVLDRNSYDVVRSPIKDQIADLEKRLQPAYRRKTLLAWSGSWKHDLGEMAAARIFSVLGLCDRRWTIGRISDAIRDDEDYMEVVRVGSFGTAQLQEARVAAADAAHDALVGDRIKHGPTPSFTALVWRHRRSLAEHALRQQKVPVRVVTTNGRTKG